MKKLRASIKPYAAMLTSLSDTQIYTPATIGIHAEKLDLLPKAANARLAKQRIRIALGRQADRNHFPKEGDATTYIGQLKVSGWFGWRWKKLLSDDPSGG